MINLSVLICHNKKRDVFLSRLKMNLAASAMFSSKKEIKHENMEGTYFILPISETQNAEVIIDDTIDISIGEKRNNLLQKAQGEYLVFIDDDDCIASNYFTEICKGMEAKVDCCSLVGRYMLNGKFQANFTHSLKYKEYFEESGNYFRPPNHLNVILTDKANKIRFTDKNYGEDTDWAMKMSESGLLQTEYEISDILYIYEKLDYEPVIAEVKQTKSGLGVRFN